MITGIEVPLELAVLLSAGSAAAGAWAGHRRANDRRNPRSDKRPDPLRELLKRGTLAEAIDLAARRNARRAGSHAVLQGRIDFFAGEQVHWHPELREQARAQVAAVMRAGLRRDDRLAMAGSDGFTIHLEGADENAAVRIARRLRRALAQMVMPHGGHGARLNARFGVAADGAGSNVNLVEMARRALAATGAEGQDHVVPASAIEEVLYLPAPTPPAPPAASAA